MSLQERQMEQDEADRYRAEIANDDRGRPAAGRGIDLAGPSLVSKEGTTSGQLQRQDRLSADPTLVHPALGAIICHQLADNVEIPRHVSILPDQYPAAAAIWRSIRRFQNVRSHGVHSDVTRASPPHGPPGGLMI